MFKIGQIVYCPLMKHTIKVEQVKTYEGTDMILLKGTRLKKDGTP